MAKDLKVWVLPWNR